MLERVARRSILFLVLGVFALANLGAAPLDNQGNAASHAPDRILVKFKSGTDPASAAAVHRQNGGTVIDTIPQVGVQVVTVPAGTVPAKVIDYGRSPSVQYAEPDYIANAVGKPTPTTTPSPTPAPSTGPNDPYLSQQWGMATVQAPRAWAVTTGSSTVPIAILDTGINQNHPDLSSKIGSQANFTDSVTLDDIYGHGTHVAGIAAAITNNGIGVAGLGYNSSIMNGKVLDDTGSGYYSWIANGITWATDNGAKVINMSLGGTAADSTLASAVDYAWSKGVVVVAAAGNNGNSLPFYPAAYDNCIAVGATDRKDAKASFSNYGSWVDVAAPGVDIYSTYNTGGYISMSGTSMASPHVAGLAALVWATNYGTGYGTGNASVRSRIENGTVQTGRGAQWTAHGLINAYNAVK